MRILKNCQLELKVNNEDNVQMIKYYKLFGRIGKLGDKYTNEARKMHWIEPNSVNKVLSFEELKAFLLNLSLPDFLNEIINIFKEDGIWYDVLSTCLELENNGDYMQGELGFKESRIICKIIPEEHPHSNNVGELTVEIKNPFSELLESKSMIESARYQVDEFYDLELNINRNTERKIASLNLKHIKS